jgi:hypothetical protein
MKKAASAVLVSSIILLLVSFGLLYAMIAIFPKIAEEYFSPVFRWSNAGTDWMFYAHPFVVSIALKWFWERYKEILPGGLFQKAIELAFVYGIVAMLPVLWLTFSAIDVSATMVLTWLAYGIFEAFIAGLVFGTLNP